MNKPLRRILIIVFALALAGLGFLFVRNLIDFPVYYAAGQSLLSGRTDLYAPDFALGRVMDYRYPPFFIVALLPLWLLPYSLAAYIWYLLSVIQISGCVLIVSRTFPSLNNAKGSWVLVALATAAYFVMALHYGNAHLLATFLLFAGLYVFLRGNDVVASLLMALAITIKITPVLLLPYFALKRRWKMLGAVCVFLLIINLLPSAFFGVRSNNQLLSNWYRHVVASQEFHEDNGPINLSIKGQLRRYFSSVDYSRRVDGDVQYPSVNITEISRESLDAAWVVIAAALFAAVLLLIWLRQSSSREVVQPDSDLSVTAAHELSLMICLMMLVGPLTSKIYFIALLWPVACLASLAVDRKTGEGMLSMLGLYAIACLNLVLPLLPGRSTQRLLLVLGLDFYVNCLVMGALMFAAVSRVRALRKLSGEPRIEAPSQARTP
jgi:glycosyl transferase family 87